jgi:hypothetical protein
LAVFGLLTLLASALYLWSSRPQRDPLAVAYEKIEEGMLTNEAIAIVGREGDSGGFTWDINGDPREMTFDEWFGFDDSHELMCKLEIRSRDGRVVKKNLESYRKTESAWERIRRWLGI